MFTQSLFLFQFHFSTAQVLSPKKDAFHFSKSIIYRSHCVICFDSWQWQSGHLFLGDHWRLKRRFLDIITCQVNSLCGRWSALVHCTSQHSLLKWILSEDNDWNFVRWDVSQYPGHSCNIIQVMIVRICKKRRILRRLKNLNMCSAKSPTFSMCCLFARNKSQEHQHYSYLPMSSFL